MSNTSLEFELTPEAERNIALYAQAPNNWRQTLERALLKITAFFLRESQLAFVKKARPGGESWPPNYGDEPGGYAWFKREILGLADPSTGVVNGELRDSMAQEINGLESRVGTTKRSGLAFTEGGTSGPFSMRSHEGKWFRFPGGTFPGRPFLPEPTWAESKAADMLRFEMDNFAAALEAGAAVGGGSE